MLKGVKKINRWCPAAGIVAVKKTQFYSHRAHPTEYLMFFCLGKKERTCDVPSADLARPPMASRAAKLRKTRRLMIYVHSKLMVSIL